MTTFALSLSNAHIWIGGSATALGLALVYGGFAQILAGMWEFVRKNTFGALAFTSYGAFWITYYVLVKFVLGGVAAATIPETVGVFLLGWTIFTFYMLIASLRTNAVLAIVFLLLTITFVLLTIGAFHTSASMNKAGGYFGLATAAFAWYASCAGVVNETWKKPVLPLFPITN
jgi:succinate-acetate transporter protein